MHSFLLTGSPLQSLFNFSLEYLAEKLSLPVDKLMSHPDVFLINTETSIPIKTVRDLKLWLKLKPFALPKKGVLIHPAHLLTLPAQNALLKTLEEPPAHTIIILTSPNSQLLLETIVSRCQLVKATPTQGTSEVTLGSSEVENKVIHQLLTELPSLSLGERLARVGEYATSRNKAIDFCDQLLQLSRSQLHQGNPSLSLKQISACLTRLHSNVNPKLTLEHLFLKL